MPGRWVRLFYRNGKSEAFPEGPRLDRARARKTPLCIHEAPALWHRCQACGAEGVWTAGWICWPGKCGHNIYCSDQCCSIANRDGRAPSWTRDEPLPPEQKRAVYQSRLERHSRDREAKRYRQCPMPDWPGEGWCSWCAGKIDPALDPDDAQRRSWHTRCVQLYFLHGGELRVQQRFLIERDGRQCAMPGCEHEGGEVDHRVPLWKVRHLAPMIRRAFYGPINLWLLCRQCHAAKTKREAAERAALAKESAQLSEPGSGVLFPESPELPRG